LGYQKSPEGGSKNLTAFPGTSGGQVAFHAITCRPQRFASSGAKFQPKYSKKK
jgi:hypothetical protein